MADFFSANGNTLLGVLAQDQSAQRSQLAKYAILQAGEHLKNGRQSEAITAFKQALAFEPSNTTALEYIGNIYQSQNNNAEAIKAFKRLVQSQPGSADAQIKLGNAYLQDKQYTESEQAYLQAARLEPRNALPEYTLGMQYLQTDRLKEAEAQFQKAQRLAPGDGNVFYAFGMLYNKQGRYDEAVTSLQSALFLKPNFPAANYELGVAYAKLGEQDAAYEQLAILQEAGSFYASDMEYVLDTPKMMWMDADKSKLNLSLGPKTPILVMDPVTLSKPGESSMLDVTIKFNNEMDVASVMNPGNWKISRAAGPIAGYYNNSYYGSADGREAKVSPPLVVTYNAATREARVSFLVTQNDAGDATIDPKHLVFTFSGKDAEGRTMDANADAINGFAGRPF